MALYINSNVASLNAQRNLQGTQLALGKNLQHLSSGLRITSAADDAAGLGISELLKAQIRSSSQAERNTNDGLSALQVADGALASVGGLLQRMRELTVQSANGVLDTTSRTYLNNEFIQLKSEIDRIGNVTSFNNVKLTDGSLSAVANALQLQVGLYNSVGGNDQISINLNDSRSAAIGVGATVIDTKANAQAAIAVVDAAISAISSTRATIGANENRLEVTVANLSTARENLSAANSRIRDVDVASETAEMTRNQILNQAGSAVLSQANQLPSAALTLLQGSR